MTVIVTAVVKLILVLWILLLRYGSKGQDRSSIQCHWRIEPENNRSGIGYFRRTFMQTERVQYGYYLQFHYSLFCWFCCCCCWVCCCSSSLMIPISWILKGNAIADGFVYHNLKDADDINGTRVYISLVNAGSIRASIDRGISCHRLSKFYRLQIFYKIITRNHIMGSLKAYF